MRLPKITFNKPLQGITDTTTPLPKQLTDDEWWQQRKPEGCTCLTAAAARACCEACGRGIIE
jgi:hypothetical protein